MVKKWSVSYPAVNGTEQRRVYVYLPTMYEADPDRRYPVLYMFDGQNVFFDEDATFGKSWGVADYLDYTDTPLIVAAVECNAGANNERLVEYSPYRFDDPQFGHFDGTGQATMSWYIHRFKPFIDRNFRTLPDRAHTFIGGSSMGGFDEPVRPFAVQRHFQPCGGAVAVHLGVAGKAFRPCGPRKAGAGHRAVHGLRLPRDGQPRRDALRLCRDVRKGHDPGHPPYQPHRARRHPQRSQLGKTAALYVPYSDV